MDVGTFPSILGQALQSSTLTKPERDLTVNGGNPPK
jgi:hypothetical protein